MCLRVRVDIVDQLREICLIVDKRTFKWCLEQGARSVLLFVECHSVGLEQFAKLVAYNFMGF